MAAKKTNRASAQLSASDYLKLPYMRVLVPEDDGTFRAEILEFPGCIATGESQQAALSTLEDVAASWVESSLGLGQEIPPPLENNDFSGKLMLRMPRSLHRKAAFAAERDGVSLNAFITNSVAEAVGLRSAPQPQAQTLARLEILVVPQTNGQPRLETTGARQFMGWQNQLPRQADA